MKREIHVMLLLLTVNSLFSQSVVTISGHTILLNDSAYVIRGVCYNPVAKGDDRFDPADYSHIDEDIQLMKDAAVNTIRTYVPVTNLQVLNKLAAAGIRVIIGFPNYDDTFQYPNINHGTYLNYINTYKNHAAILMWELGNEYNYHPEWFNNNISNWYTILNNAAAKIHLADANHPVSTAHGEVPNSTTLSSCPNVDVWGMNVYRWDNPSGAITQFAAVSGKPCYLSEAGGDRFNNSMGAENQQNQAEADLNTWNSIKGKLNLCSGITFFSFVDEWWKSGNPSSHDNGGFSISVPYDNYANEEWWGIVDIDRNTTLAYEALKEAFTEQANSIAAVPIYQARLFPNPCKNTLKLCLDHPINEKVNICLSRISGSNVLQFTTSISGSELELMLNDPLLINGVYMVRILSKSLNISRLLIISK